ARPLPGRVRVRDPYRDLVADGQGHLWLDTRNALRDAGRGLAAAALAAGRLLLVADLLRRRLPGPAREDARHDGAGRGRDRHRLDLLGRGHLLDLRRRLLRSLRLPRDLRAARALVRNARPRRRQRRHPSAARPQALTTTSQTKEQRSCPRPTL